MQGGQQRLQQTRHSRGVPLLAFFVEVVHRVEEAAAGIACEVGRDDKVLAGWAGIAPTTTPEGLDARLSAIAERVREAVDWPRIRALV